VFFFSFSISCLAQTLVHFTALGSPHFINGSSPLPTGIEDGIIVETGADLIICCRDGSAGSTLKFNSGAEIVVQKGGLLQISSSVLEQNSSNLYDVWDGIVVFGHDRSEQYLATPILPLSSTSNNADWEGSLNFSGQGVLYLNSSTIINAKNGIESIDGGILRVQDHNPTCNAVFLNYVVGVKSTHIVHLTVQR